MVGVISAWAIGEGIICYRAIKGGRPPLPSELLASSGLFVMLAVLAQGAPQLAVTLAVGVDVAAVLQLWPVGSTTQAPPAGKAPAPVPVPKANGSDGAPNVLAMDRVSLQPIPAAGNLY